MNKIERNVKGGISLETRIIITQIFQRENILYFYPHRGYISSPLALIRSSK